MGPASAQAQGVTIAVAPPHWVPGHGVAVQGQHFGFYKDETRSIQGRLRRHEACRPLRLRSPSTSRSRTVSMRGSTSPRRPSYRRRRGCGRSRTRSRLLLKVRHPWGFGMSPISNVQRVRYDSAVRGVRSVLCVPARGVGICSADDVSHLKGMFNRIRRQDQWDWFSVHYEFGLPPIRTVRLIADALVSLRRAVSGEWDGLETASRRLRKVACHVCLDNYLSSDDYPYRRNDSYGWIYVLSTRNQPTHLKIGRTDRNVFDRVSEINRATGVVVPFSVRMALRVSDSVEAERIVFLALRSFRIRKDREFFDAPFRLVEDRIKDVLQKAGLLRPFFFCSRR